MLLETVTPESIVIIPLETTIPSKSLLIWTLPEQTTTPEVILRIFDFDSDELLSITSSIPFDADTSDNA